MVFTSLSHLGSMAKYTFLSPGSILTFACNSSALKTDPSFFVKGTL